MNVNIVIDTCTNSISDEILGLHLFVRIPVPKFLWPIKLQDSSKEMNDEVYFRHADKHQIFLHVDTIILGVCSQACPKFYTG